MIKAVIAILGEDEELVREQLADVLSAEPFGRVVVYRAWTESVDRDAVNAELAGPTELDCSRAVPRRSSFYGASCSSPGMDS